MVIEGVNAPAADAKYPFTILLTVSEENLKHRYVKRGSEKDKKRIENIDSVLSQQYYLKAEAKQKGWFVIENEDTPDNTVSAIISEVNKRLKSKNTTYEFAKDNCKQKND